MKNRTCPNCRGYEFNNKELWLHILIGRKLACGNCGSRLKIRTSMGVNLVNGFLTQLIFFGFYTQNWLVFIFVALFAFMFNGLFYTFGSLTRVGIKQFKL